MAVRGCAAVARSLRNVPTSDHDIRLCTCALSRHLNSNLLNGTIPNNIANNAYCGEMCASSHPCRCCCTLR